MTPKLTATQALALRRLLAKIASWTSDRWTSHLRHDVGDADADAIIAWVDFHIADACNPEGASR